MARQKGVWKELAWERSEMMMKTARMSTDTFSRMNQRLRTLMIQFLAWIARNCLRNIMIINLIAHSHLISLPFISFSSEPFRTLTTFHTFIMPLSSTAEPLPKIHVKLRTQPSRSLGHPSSPRLLSHPKTTIHQTQLDKPQYSIGTRLRTITASQQATSQGNAPKRQKVQPRAIQFSFELQKRKAGLEGGKQPGEIKVRPGRQQDGEGTIQVRRRQNLQGDFGQIALAGTPQEDCNQLTDKVQNHQKQVRFAQLLRHKNPFFAKLGGVVALALLKIGTVVAFAAGDLLYQEARPIRHLGLILWGKLWLKKQKPKWKLQITSGQAIGEEIIFEQEDLRKRGKQITSRGQLLAFEDCRAITDCGVLLVGAKQIGWMDEQLSIEGLREQTLRFHSLLFRVYLKKRELRDHLR